MSVLINMEMPTSCSDCPMCGLYSEHKGDVHRCDITFYPVEYEDGLDKQHERCPLIPVPPHGRLIDADDMPWIEGKDEQDKPVYLLLKYHVDLLPTIIPADPAEEGEG